MDTTAYELVYLVYCERFFQESVVLEKGEWVQNWYVICDIFEIMKSKNI